MASPAFLIVLEATSGFWAELAKNLPEVISRVKDNWIGLIALVVIVTTVLIVLIAPPTERKRIVYIFLIGAMMLIASAFYEGVRQQDRLNAAQAVVAPAPVPESKPQTAKSTAKLERNGQPSHKESLSPSHQNWCSEDPDTKIPFSRDISFGPGDHQTGRRRGGDTNTPGSEWIFEWTAPGPVYSVSARQTGWWEQIDSCSAQGNIAHCEGWINGGNAPIIMTVKWKQPCAADSENTKNSNP
jgi:hypothetical protein